MLQSILHKEATSLRHIMKKFELFIVGVARRESPQSNRSSSPISWAF
jgi:hypothetical protein